jgi:hypothetical protein
MKASNPFKNAIKAYLDKRASEDELFAETYKKPNKTLDECCNYVMQCAKKGGYQAYTDDEVFGWAVHYYDEDSIKDIKPVNGKVSTSKDSRKSTKEKTLVDKVLGHKKTKKEKEEIFIDQTSLYD